MTRILLWSTSFWPHIGGVEVLGGNFVEALVERGHDVTVLTRRDIDDLPAEDHVAGARVVRHRFRQVIEGRDATAAHTLRQDVTRLKYEVAPDLVHLYHLGPDLLFHRLTAAAAPVPDVVTLHQPFDDDVVADGGALGTTLREAAWIAACSRAVLEKLHAQVPEVTARSGLVVNALPPSAMAADPVDDGPPVVLFVGRVVPQKGFDRGVRAFAEVLAAHPEARLVVAGDGIARPALQGLAAELGIEAAVTWAGWSDLSRVRALMRTATVVVMPSRVEPFGLVALEAAQMRRPVVATAVDGLPEAVADGESGLLVPPDDHAALVAAIEAIVDDRALARRLGDGGWERAQSGAAWDRHVDAYEAIYRRVCGG